VLTEGVDIHLPDFLIRLPFHMPYRQLERFARNLPEYIERSVAPYYIGLNRRVKERTKSKCLNIQ